MTSEAAPAAPYTLWASLYDAFEADDAAATWRAGVLAELLRLDLAAPRVLDIGAGTGIGGRVMADALPGATVVSLDRSSAMLDAGRVPHGQRIVADMADFAVEGALFDVVTCGFDALNCLAPDRLARCLACVARALRPGGVFVFDYSMPHLLEVLWAHLDVVTDNGGPTLHRRHRFDPAARRLRVDLELWVEGRAVWQETHFHYALDAPELIEAASRHGFAVDSVRDLAGQDGQSPTARVFVLRRPAPEGRA